MTFELYGVYILSAQFSPTRPCVFGICTTNGEILIFDLKVNKKKEVLKNYNLYYKDIKSKTK